ncbi:MAG: hypothetical protein U9Q12_03035 [Patescibacteria group bacterium]|nr:hypothetical protein [Patescibacteria group bacterium]
MNKQTTIWIVVTTAVIIFVGAIILGVGSGVGYWYMSNRMTSPPSRVAIPAEPTAQVQQIKENVPVVKDAVEEKIYTNKEFGFALQMTPTWEDYVAKEVVLGGDFNVAQVDFYLPTQEIVSDTEVPGHMHLFTISVYITESWDEAVAEGILDEALYGEIVGENEFYLFVYSHFNGIPPADISTQAVIDMDKIAKNIKTFTPQDVAYDDPVPFDAYQGEVAIDYDALYSDYYAVDNTFMQNAIEYWNCAYRYELHYPSAWSNNGMTNMSDTVILKGNDGIETKIQAVDAHGMNVDDFFKSQYAKEFPLAQIEPTAEKLLVPENNTVVYYLAFAAPYERRLYWKVDDSDMGIQMTVKNIGTDEWNNMTDMLGSLQMNTEHRVECAG